MKKKKRYLGDILLILSVLTLGGILLFGHSDQALGISSSQSIVHYEFPVPPATPMQGGPNNQVATTTLIYLTTTGATSTLPGFDTSDADYVDLDIQLVSSSSATNLYWTIEHSINNLDWFPESTKNVITGGSTVLTASTTYSWIPGFAGRGGTTVATATLNTQIPNVATPFTRVNFNVTGANGAIWVTLVKRVPNRR